MSKASASLAFELTPFLFVPGTEEDPTAYPAWFAGIRSGGGFAVDCPDTQSVMYHLLLPTNVNTGGVSGSPDDAFEFSGFPALANTGASASVLDANGLPLNLGTVSLIAVYVRKIDPAAPAGGSVSVTTADGLTPGDTFGIVTDAERLASLADPAGWAPEATGKINIKWTPESGVDIGDINLACELVIIGNPAP